MRLVKLTKEEWAAFAERAHLIVFKEIKSAESDRIDFALVIENAVGIPMAYVTCREFDSETLYFQYGGAFPGTKDTPQSFRCFEQFLKYAKEAHYGRVTLLVQNDNVPMLKLAMKSGMRITGLRTYKTNILLEHLLEFVG